MKLYLYLISIICFSASGMLPQATDLNDADMNRCLASLHAAKNLKLTNKKLWMNEYWPAEYGGKKNAKPFFKALDLNKNDSPPDMSIFKEYESGCIIAKGRQLIISLPGAALAKKIEDFAVLRKRSQDFSSPQDGRYWSHGLAGRGHWGAFQIARCYTKNIEDDVRKYANDQGLDLKDLQIIFAGHSFGGMIAQYLAIDLINRVYNPALNFSSPKNHNNIIVVSLGAPAIFNEEGCKAWNKKLGGKFNHLRIIIDGDSIAKDFMSEIQDYDQNKTFIGQTLGWFGKMLWPPSYPMTLTKFTGTKLELPKPKKSSSVDRHHGLTESYTPAFVKKYGYQE
ncbi:MAG: hypothetical protein CMM87_03910 [Rickettsiales bacterium]|nr:hypothetical protein [Rickettsiales bacterium]|tara:strand:- start:72641 stop:73654 length:1014 start_codon:yes stop_codon:yes gene_type:complete